MRARLLSILLMMFALAVPGLAQDRRGGSSLDRVLPQIRHSVPGTFYDADGPFLGSNGQATYRIKWMTPDGRMIWFYVDARSGQVLGGAPSGRYREDRYRDDYDRSGQGSWGGGAPPRSDWRRDDGGRGTWGDWGGRGGDDNRGQGGWGGRGGDDRGSQGGRGGDGRGGQGGRGDNDRGQKNGDHGSWSGGGHGKDNRGGDGGHRRR